MRHVSRFSFLLKPSKMQALPTFARVFAGRRQKCESLVSEPSKCYLCGSSFSFVYAHCPYLVHLIIRIFRRFGSTFTARQLLAEFQVSYPQLSRCVSKTRINAVLYGTYPGFLPPFKIVDYESSGSAPVWDLAFAYKNSSPFTMTYKETHLLHKILANSTSPYLNAPHCIMVDRKLQNVCIMTHKSMDRGLVLPIPKDTLLKEPSYYYDFSWQPFMYADLSECYNPDSHTQLRVRVQPYEPRDYACSLQEAYDKYIGQPHCFVPYPERLD